MKSVRLAEANVKSSVCVPCHHSFTGYHNQFPVTPIMFYVTCYTVHGFVKYCWYSQCHKNDCLSL